MGSGAPSLPCPSWWPLGASPGPTVPAPALPHLGGSQTLWLKVSPPHPQLNAELKENLKDTMTKRYHQKGHEGVTSAVDKLQQEVGGWHREGCACLCGPPQTCPVPTAGVGSVGAQPGCVPAAVPLLWQQQLPGLAGQ